MCFVLVALSSFAHNLQGLTVIVPVWILVEENGLSIFFFENDLTACMDVALSYKCLLLSRLHFKIAYIKTSWAIERKYMEVRL
jgi:hypothetical protein